MNLASGFTNDQLILAPIGQTKAPKPTERPRICPHCGRTSLKRRVRQSWERILCAVTTPAVKIRPYQCTQCQHRNWELVRWAQPLELLGSPKIIAGFVVTGILAAGLVIWAQLDLLLPQKTSASSMPALEMPTRLSQIMEPVAPAQPSAPLPANFLASATLDTLDGHRVLRLRDNGTLREYRTWMQQESRRRFVIDLPGSWAVADTVPASLNLKGTHADRINISAYPEHLRVSIRIRTGADGLPQIAETADGLNIRLD